MGWLLEHNQIVFRKGHNLITPSARDIFSLNSIGITDNPLLHDVPAPSDELNIRFSRMNAMLLFQFSFEESTQSLSLELFASKKNVLEKLSYNSDWLPDSVVIQGIWYSLLSSHDTALDLLKKSNIHNAGTISLKQYAILKKEIFQYNDISIVDHVEQKLVTHSAQSSEVDIPTTIRATLYPYQKQGYRWMNFITTQSCGCILGDEMGLGKTLQVITLLAYQKEHGLGPSLVIAPVSLLENWKREFEKFTINMRVFVHHGATRTGLYSELLNYDVVIISYNTAVTDFSLLKMISWDLLILDEAQNIKNPSATRTRIVKELSRISAIAITGTPFENHLTDLWSLMDFALPGYLGTLSSFQKEFSDDIDGSAKLEPFISPFIIRRRVSEVAQELPKRIDIPQPLCLTEKNIFKYELVRKQTLAEYGGKKATLPMLQKLRMFCTHPALLGESTSSDPVVESEKYERLCELLEEIVFSGEKVILFTSYNEMFDILKKDISVRFGIPLFVINGSTVPQDRQPIIDTFSAVQGTALLALNPRAAGTGLNITAATRVIHYNLEWNPALEDQASARAYRRGQTRPVFIYRLFYKNTVEEIINSRIEKKREMFGAAVVGVDGECENREDIMHALMISPGGDENGQ